MRKIVSFQAATKLSLVLFGLFTLFHLSIIIGILFFRYAPVEFLWGGRLKTKEELLGFEIISLAVMALCFFIVLIKSKRVKMPGLTTAATIALWILVVVFTLNTLGNIFAKTTFEKSFAIVTAVLALLSLRLALERDQVT